MEYNTEKQQRKISEMKNWFLEKINKIYKFLARLIRKKERERYTN